MIYLIFFIILICVLLYVRYKCFHEWELTEQFHEKKCHTMNYRCRKCAEYKTEVFNRP